MRILLTILIVLAVLYAAAAVLLYMLQDRFLFFPRAELRATPGDLGMPFEEVQVTTSDGVRLHGWFVPAAVGDGTDSVAGDSGDAEPSADAEFSPKNSTTARARTNASAVALARTRASTVLFCHGNGGNISSTVEAVRTFHGLGLNVLTFDYRGYGLSEGTPSEEGLYRDAERMWEYLTRERGVSADRIVIVGRSLGCAVATWLAERHRPGAVILESPFTSAAAMGDRQFPFLPVRLLMRHRFDNLERMPRVPPPILIVHSRDDALIPIEHGRELYAAARSPKQFLEIRGGHNEGFALSAEEYVAGVRGFLQGNRE